MALGLALTALSLAGCGTSDNGGSASTQDSGGYTGKSAAIYQEAKASCQQVSGQGITASKVSKSTEHIFTQFQLAQPSLEQLAALNDGCKAGLGPDQEQYANPFYNPSSTP